MASYMTVGLITYRAFFISTIKRIYQFVQDIIKGYEDQVSACQLDINQSMLFILEVAGTVGSDDQLKNK